MPFGSTPYYTGRTPVVPNTFPNTPNYEVPNYGAIVPDKTDLGYGSTTAARDRWKEIGGQLVETAGKLAYAFITRKSEDLQNRNPPTTGSPVAPRQTGTAQETIEGGAARSGLTNVQLAAIVILGGLLLIGITRG